MKEKRTSAGLPSFILAALAIFLGTTDSFGAERESVHVHVPSFDISVITLYVAKDMGYFTEERVETPFVLATPGVGINGLVAGNFHFSAAAGSASTAIARNMPLKVVLIHTFKPGFWIYARENIKGLLQLKGKKLGVSTIGALPHTLAKLALMKAGLDPDREVVMIAAGTDEVRFAALQIGAVDAAVFNAPLKIRAKREGLKEVSFLGEEVYGLSGGVVTSVRMIQTRPDTVQRFVTAALKGLKYFLANREGSIPIMAKHMKVEPGMAKELYETTIETFTEDGTTGEDFMKSEAQLQATALGLKEVPPFDRPFDLSFARRANQILKNWKPQ
ncbi:MAG: ABC transporter substrate-binding protein [Deltaproteobacteria bacterium]|nr:ABC transporter substrate-binding protein [Deltaproteobacteria bacterium]